MIERRNILIGIGATGVSLSAIGRRGWAQQASQVKGVYAAPGLSFSAIFLAERTGLWAKNGLGVELKQVQGGPLTMVALTMPAVHGPLKGLMGCSCIPA